ncbi:MAG: 3'-5' exonuclease, partial [Pseudomonadota bacterium]
RDNDALQLRLESDEALVQIVTLHKSKGLQYPIVILPFVSLGQVGSNRSADFVVYAEHGEPRLDVGSEDLSARQAAQRDADTDESMRLLYVGLTRAERACWVGITHNKGAAQAPLFHLMGLSLQSRDAAECSGLIENELSELTSMCPDIAYAPALDHELSIQSTESQGAQALTARVAARTVPPSWRVGSYSALARRATHLIERPDHDAVDIAVEPVGPPDFNSPFSFPRGANAGTLVHAVFEQMDFRGAASAEFDGLVTQQLRAHATDSIWAPALKTLVYNTVSCVLPHCEIPLSAIDPSDRLDELGFHFPARRVNAEAMVALLQQFGVLHAEESFTFEVLDGYMTGFIDLVFRHAGRWYIVDYKSNHLGDSVGQYAQPALDTAMRHHRYDLQYLIYSVALLRYLRRRMPGFDAQRDFGGVFYLFVRGMQPGADGQRTDCPGVFSNRPPQSLLDSLDALFAGT